jgi:hypothetical protein
MGPVGGAAGACRREPERLHRGLQADIERRLPDAIGWYRVALETHVGSVYETQLAYQRLGGWQQSGRSIATLSALPAGEDTPRF